MSTRTVGPSSTYATIAQAMLNARPGDSIVLESGYGGETATVTKSGITVIGDATSLGITLRLGSGVGTFKVSGAAPIDVIDAVTGASTEGNTITGGSGNNVVTVSGGVDAVNGGLGTDRLVVNYAGAGGAVTGDSTSNFTDAGGGRTVTITAGTFEHFTIRTGDFADTITTGAGNDAINVGDGANTVTAGGGANSIRGGVGADTFTALGGGNFMDGSDGANVLTSGDGNDTILSGRGADTIVSGGGIDAITVRGGADTVKAGAQVDRLIVDYSDMITNVTSTLSGTVETGYTGRVADQVGSTVDFTGVESFSITSGSGADTIKTGGGADTIKGGAGADTLAGAAGNDTLDGGMGNDRLEGGAGNDTYVLAAAGDTVVEAAGGGTDQVNAAVTVTLAANVENLVLTGSGDANGTGNGLANRLTGNSGSNSLSGADGNDTMNGGSGADILTGGRGADVLTGGRGADVLTGGLGTDDFVFNAVAESGLGTQRDTITSFARGWDDIALSAIDANTALGGNQAFKLDAGGAFSAGEIRQTQSSSNLLIELNTDGDTTAEMSILLNNVTGPLSANDFLF